jgi:hypothetical protein
MNFNIAISRAATFARAKLMAGHTIRPLSGDNLYDTFAKQAEIIASHPKLKSANDAVWRVASQADPKARRLPCGHSDSRDGIGALAVLNVADEFADAALGRMEALVARMRSERIEVQVADVKWIIRTRASVTSCALEGNKRPTKLWWTFEGIPANADPDHRPNEEQVAALLSITGRMEKAARAGLKDAYEGSLFSMLSAKGKLLPHRERLSITLTECVDQEVDSLLDAMYFDAADVSEIKNSNVDELGKARVGMEFFERFVRSVAGSQARVQNTSVSIAEGIPKVKAVLWRGHSQSDSLVVGFARRVGANIGLGILTADERRKELTEERVRLQSAARPLSALLASKEAGALDSRLRHMEPS